MADRNELLNLSKALDRELLDKNWPERGEADALYRFPLLLMQKWRKLLERSIVLSARRNVPGQANHPVLLLVEVIRWQRDYDCSPEMFTAWTKADDRMHSQWLGWHARFWEYEQPTIEDTLARAEVLWGKPLDRLWPATIDWTSPAAKGLIAAWEPVADTAGRGGVA